MDLIDSTTDWFADIAAASDVCMKPWRHAAIGETNENSNEKNSEDFVDLVVRIECRNKEGERKPERDLELEIFESGKELNLVLSWFNKPEKPILWHGHHSVWMDGNTGVRCLPPDDGGDLESLARRLRALFLIDPEKVVK